MLRSSSRSGFSTAGERWLRLDRIDHFIVNGVRLRKGSTQVSEELDQLRVAWVCGTGGAFELFDSSQGLRLERGRIAGDCRFTGPLHLRRAPVERRNQLEQLADGMAGGYCQRRALWRSGCARETFQTSPQLVHRQ